MSNKNNHDNKNNNHEKKHKKKKRRKLFRRIMNKVIPVLGTIVGILLAIFSNGVFGYLSAYIVGISTDVPVDNADTTDSYKYGKNIARKSIANHIMLLVGAVSTIVSSIIYGYYVIMAIGIVGALLEIKYLYDTIPGYVFVHC